MTSAELDATVLICTYNRAEKLGETLDSIARSRVDPDHPLRWNVVVVDNNSTDATRAVVQSRIAAYPVPLLYLFESTQGKSTALNSGLAAVDAAVIVFTDDDVRVGAGWIDALCRPMMDDPSIAYTGGPVVPIWERPRPDWLDDRRSELWGTIAVLDYGSERFVFEDRRRIPLGANMAVRRTLIQRIGAFDPRLGRTGSSLLGQEQAEFFCRSRAIGARGIYVPDAGLHHHVPASRLTRAYFRRWWFWKGISKYRLESLHPVTELGVDLTDVPRVAGIPRFMFGSAIRDCLGWTKAWFARDSTNRMRHEMMLCYFAGYLRGARRSAPV